jgi:subtilisin family serine protease
MKRTLRLALVAGLAAGFAPATAAQEEPLAVAAQEQQEGDLAALVDETPDLWFVELSSPPAVEGTSAATLRAEKAAFRANAKKAGLAFAERYAFDGLFNGLSVRIDKGDLAKLSRIEGVKAIWPVLEAKTTAGEAAPEMATALAMTGADVAQSGLGYTGRGVKVAVMDTGIDIDHPDFGGNGTPGSTLFPTTRIAYGYDFVGDAFTGGNTPVPDDNPDDCGGHGSHVAGIIGANGVVKGVAPEVTLGAYRVFGCAGSTNSDIMIAAMERALADGMQVLNMSIGSAFMTWPQYPTAAAATRLVNKGVVVVASIGNSGGNGLYSAGAPGVGDKVIGVASFDNTRVTQFAFTISPDGRAIGYGGATAAPVPQLSGTYPMARTGTQTTTNDGCAALGTGTLTGKVALIRRGTCGFYDKARNAQAAGAAGVVLYNNAPGTLTPTVAGAVAITIPVVMISQLNGNLIDSRLASGPVDLTWTNQTVTASSSTGGLISSFSSYGLDAELTVKPDIGAPGGDIWSTYPLEYNGYANLGGTSMASPHTAGAVALLLEARPHTSAQSVRAILQNSADPKNWWGNPALGLDNVHRQGAGLLDVDDAILSTVRIEPGKLSLGESEAGPATRTLTLKNDGALDATFDLSHAPALSSGAPTNATAINTYTGFASVAFSTPSITVPAGGTASIDVTIAANPSLADRSMYGGYVVFTPQGGGQTYRVPYAGFKGDYQSVQVLTPGGSTGFPRFGRYVGGTSYQLASAGATFTMTATDRPAILAHLEHQARRLRVEIVAAATGRSWHRAFDEEYMPRNSTATGFFGLPWDGYTVAGNRLYTVPDGQYVMKLSVLKALGDAANPAHWETWTSPAFNVARP